MEFYFSMQYEKVVDIIRDKPQFLFYKAYSEYRLGKFLNALSSLDSDVSDTVDEFGKSNLRAQILYRLGRYSDAIAIYESLLEGVEDDWDLASGYIASLVAGGRSSAVLTSSLLKAYISSALTQDVVELGIPYEFLYNLSCAFLDSEYVNYAPEVLRSAFKAGIHFATEEGMSKKEIREDLASLCAQAAYLFQTSSFSESAKTLYNEVIRPEEANKKDHFLSTNTSSPSIPFDATSIVTSINNSMALANSGKDVIRALSQIKAALSSDDLSSRFTGRQLLTLLYNQTLLCVQIGRIEEAQATRDLFNNKLAEAKSVNKAESVTGGLGPHMTFLEESMHILSAVLDAVINEKGMKNKFVPVTQELVSKALQNLPSSSAALPSNATALVRSQLLLGAGDAKGSYSALSDVSKKSTDALPASSYASLAYLAYASGDAEEAQAILDQGVHAWEKKYDSADKLSKRYSLAPLVLMYSLRSGFFASTNKFEKAIADQQTILGLENITQEQISASTATAAFLKVLLKSPGTANADIERAVKLAEEASQSAADTQSEKLLESLDQTIRTGKGAAASSTKQPTKALTAAQKEAKKRRAKALRAKKREAYLAKLAQESTVGISIGRPDPDRWLSKAQRSRGRRKQTIKGAYVGAGAIQGGADATITDKLDARARAEANKTTAAGRKGRK